MSVRQAAGLALGVQRSVYAIEGLADLCLDPCDEVRNWSVFTLKQVVQRYIDEDSLDMVPEPREIFYGLLSDLIECLGEDDVWCSAALDSTREIYGLSTVESEEEMPQK